MYLEKRWLNPKKICEGIVDEEKRRRRLLLQDRRAILSRAFCIKYICLEIDDDECVYSTYRWGVPER